MKYDYLSIEIFAKNLNTTFLGQENAHSYNET